jgi:PBP1b-binding outer membrane lipoprotein LpoB
MKYLLIALAVLLTGCSTTAPVVAKFPEKPKYSESCPQLQKLNDDAKLSDVSTTVNINYSTYYECAMKVDTWREWYEIQRRIYESVK